MMLEGRTILLICLMAAAACAGRETRPADGDVAQAGSRPDSAAPANSDPTEVSAQTDAQSSETENLAVVLDEDEAPRWKRTPDVIYVPTPQPVVDKMLEMAKVSKKDVVYDLGCGDGRIPVTAATRYGAKAYGVDLDPDRIDEALENVRKNKVEHLVTIEEGDVFELDLRPASVVTIYLLPELNVKLLPQLRKLKPGSRVVTHDFDIEGVEAKDHYTWKPSDDPDAEEHYVFLYETPL
jgi:SAM-dependent methyltransferase